MALRVSTIGWGNLQVVIVVDMAGGTQNVGVTIRQRKARRAVIKVGVQPTVKVVAALAIGSRKCRPRRGMRRIRGVLPVFQVAGITLRGQAKKLARCGLRVALLAGHRRVRAK